MERCQPSVWSMRSSPEEASQAREGHTHTHTKFPKAIHLLNANTLYTHLYNTVQSLKSTSAHTHATHQTHTHTQSLAHVWLSDRLLLHLSALTSFDSEQGRTNPSEMFLSHLGAKQTQTLFRYLYISL